jgi:hypothetical protein
LISRRIIKKEEKMVKKFDMWLLENSQGEGIDLQELTTLIQDAVLGNAERLRFTSQDGARLIEIIDSNPFIKQESLAFLRAKGATQLFRGTHDEWDPEWDEWETGMASFTYNRDVAESFGDGGSIVTVDLNQLGNDLLISIEWAAKWLGIAPLSEEEDDIYQDSDGWDDTDDIGFRGMIGDQYECLLRWPSVAAKCRLEDSNGDQYEDEDDDY